MFARMFVYGKTNCDGVFAFGYFQGDNQVCNGTSFFATGSKSSQPQAPIGFRNILPEPYWCLQMG